MDRGFKIEIGVLGGDDAGDHAVRIDVGTLGGQALGGLLVFDLALDLAVAVLHDGLDVVSVLVIFIGSGAYQLALGVIIIIAD